ncbi:hypothetical protein [Halobacillus mangrovi]|uniref:Permuted papain-like amidase enzyme, YaeF/YiiX, C92 family n=1 Tax=Halobacillus mangrovi TaxID=402384 RepID=A0A1W5ZVJ3_9BACI|nr:hypothetical protein [Halobacillus mangrovi]ARI77352.1 hypothetical protein HM131_11085 [Halobacillus mangrovi]
MRRKSFMAVSAFIISLLGYIILPKKVKAPTTHKNPDTYPGTDIVIEPGDLLFSPLGKSESKYVGHVGMVNHAKKVVHSIPAGLIQDDVPTYFNKFRSIKVYAPRVDSHRNSAAAYLEKLYLAHKNADYRIMTPLAAKMDEQYCTKIVWQSYYYGAGVNLGSFNQKAKAIHPELLKDRNYILPKNSFK